METQTKIGVHTPRNTTKVFLALQALGLSVEDCSWRNDAADRLELIGTNISIWMPNKGEDLHDYSIEISPEWSTGRHHGEIQIDHTLKSLLAFFASDEYKLARAFSALVCEQIGDKETIIEMLEANEANVNDKSICATHDYIDSNQTMLDSFAQVFGRECDLDYENPQGKPDNEIFGKAWDIAKQFRFFYAPTEQVEAEIKPIVHPQTKTIQAIEPDEEMKEIYPNAVSHWVCTPSKEYGKVNFVQYADGNFHCLISNQEYHGKSLKDCIQFITEND